VSNFFQFNLNIILSLLGTSLNKLDALLRNTSRLATPVPLSTRRSEQKYSNNLVTKVRRLMSLPPLDWYKS